MILHCSQSIQRVKSKQNHHSGVCNTQCVVEFNRLLPEHRGRGGGGTGWVQSWLVRGTAPQLLLQRVFLFGLLFLNVLRMRSSICGAFEKYKAGFVEASPHKERPQKTRGWSTALVSSTMAGLALCSRSVCNSSPSLDLERLCDVNFGTPWLYALKPLAFEEAEGTLISG